LVRALALCAAFGVPVALVAVYRVDGAHPQAMLGGLGLPVELGCGTIVLPTRGLPLGVRRRAVVGLALIVLGGFAMLQFRDFYADYLTAYQERFVSQTDGTVHEALDTAIARMPDVQLSQMRRAPAIYLGFRFGRGDWGTYYWLSSSTSVTGKICWPGRSTMSTHVNSIVSGSVSCRQTAWSSPKRAGARPTG
jgi:hypothetical protein